MNRYKYKSVPRAVGKPRRIYDTRRCSECNKKMINPRPNKSYCNDSCRMKANNRVAKITKIGPYKYQGNKNEQT